MPMRLRYPVLGDEGAPRKETPTIRGSVRILSRFLGPGGEMFRLTCHFKLYHIAGAWKGAKELGVSNILGISTVPIHF